MTVHEPRQLEHQLEERIRTRTGRRIRDLMVLFEGERVVLCGLAATYHVKQLAQHGVRDMLPDVRLENTIVVDYGKVYATAPLN